MMCSSKMERLRGSRTQTYEKVDWSTLNPNDFHDEPDYPFSPDNYISTKQTLSTFHNLHATGTPQTSSIANHLYMLPNGPKQQPVSKNSPARANKQKMDRQLEPQNFHNVLCFDFTTWPAPTGTCHPLAEVSPGFVIQLRGYQEARAASKAAGRTTTVKCVSCSSILQCVLGAEFVLCSECRFIGLVSSHQNGYDTIDNNFQLGGGLAVGLKTHPTSVVDNWSTSVNFLPSSHYLPLEHPKMDPTDDNFPSMSMTNKRKALASSWPAKKYRGDKSINWEMLDFSPLDNARFDDELLFQEVAGKTKTSNEQSL